MIGWLKRLIRWLTNKLTPLCTKIGIPTKLGVGAIVRFWVAFREGGIIKSLIKIFKWLTNKFKQICKWIFCEGQFKSIVASVVIFIIVYISVNWWFVPDADRKMQMVELVRNGLFGIGALVGLWIAYYRTDALQKQAKTAERGRTDKQFSQSVTLLAKDNKDKPAIEARVGGIYALAQLGEANPKGYGAQVMKTLVVYIRNNAQRTAILSERDRNESIFSPERRSEAAHLGEDVKTAFAELKRLHSNKKVRGKSKVSPEDLSFSHADFHALRLNEIEWIKKPDLSHANLSGANLYLARLQGANLNGATLQGTDLWHAELIGAKLHSANLQGANLDWANLEHTRLHKANLQGANLEWTNLQDADLQGANLQGAYFRNAILQNTNFNRAIAIYTTFEDISLTKEKMNVTAETVQEWKVWHDNDSFWDSYCETEGFESLEKDIKWDLNLIFLEITEPSDVVFILEGILRNFAERGENKSSLRAIECRKAVKQWVIDHNLWKHLSDDWRDWLRSLDDEGRAPDDK